MIYVGRNTGPTSSLKRHLRSKHGTVYKNENIKKAQKSDFGSKLVQTEISLLRTHCYSKRCNG